MTSVTGPPSRGCRADDDVIVHGIWDPEVREQSLEAIEAVFRKYGLSYEIIRDFYEKEKGVAHHGG